MKMPKPFEFPDWCYTEDDCPTLRELISKYNKKFEKNPPRGRPRMLNKEVDYARRRLMNDVIARRDEYKRNYPQYIDPWVDFPPLRNGMPPRKPPSRPPPSLPRNSRSRIFNRRLRQSKRKRRSQRRKKSKRLRSSRASRLSRSRS